MIRPRPLTSMLVLCGLWFVATGMAATVPAQTAAQGTVPADFPAGSGREVVVKICRDCHAATDITRRRESRYRWSEIVGQMIGQGARISDADFEVAVSYLSVVLGRRVKINAATAEVIAETFDIDEETAAAIVKFRTDKGAFKDWQALAAVPGVDPKRIEEQKDNLDFGVGAPGY